VTSPHEPAHAVLLGADHPSLGSVAVTGAAGQAVVALTAGMHPKPYPHLDPNEDAILAAVGDRCRLLAVADGHNGFDAAAGAIRGLRGALDTLAAAAAEPSGAVEELAAVAIKGVREALSDVDAVRRELQHSFGCPVLILFIAFSLLAGIEGLFIAFVGLYLATPTIYFLASRVSTRFKGHNQVARDMRSGSVWWRQP
jgi:hypothetical protein